MMNKLPILLVYESMKLSDIGFIENHGKNP